MIWYTILVVLLVLLGVALMIVELFLIPGFGLSGVAGIGAMGGAIYVSYRHLATVYPWAGHITLTACLILTIVAIWIFLRSKALQKMALNTAIDSKVELAKPGKKIENLKKDAAHLENAKQ